MSNLNIFRIKGKFIWIYMVLAVLFVLVTALINATLVEAKRSGGGACNGTYFVEVGEPTPLSYGLWTLSQDGTVQVTDSAELTVGFSHEQGAWVKTKDRNAVATFIDLSFDTSTGAHTGYGRVDADFQFSGDCSAISGTVELRLYDDPTDDPLDPSSADNLFPIGQFSGRRVYPGT